MKKAVFFSAMAALAAAGAPAFAQETGRVISSTPVVQQVAVPRQVCGTQTVMQQQPSNGGGAVLGAIIGGVLGNGIGHGAGRAVATGAGILGGAMVGDRLQNNQGYAQNVQNCTTQTSYENRTVGYNVTYEYGGRQYTAQMPNDPGQTIQLNVSPQGANGASVSSNGVVMAPPMAQSNVQPYAGAPETYPVQTVEAPVVYAAPAYPVAYAPAYYRPYYSPYYAPVGLSLSFGYVGGGWGGHRHWR